MCNIDLRLVILLTRPMFSVTPFYKYKFKVCSFTNFYFLCFIKKA